jgi:WD40 repeat protein
VTIWNIAEGSIAAELHGHARAVNAVAWLSPPFPQVPEFNAGEHDSLTHSASRPVAFAAADGGESHEGELHLLSAGSDGRILHWRLHTLQPDLHAARSRSSQEAMDALHTSSSALITSSYRVLVDHPHPVTALRLFQEFASGDEPRMPIFAIADDDGGIMIHSIDGGRLATLDCGEAHAMSLSFNESGAALAVGLTSGAIHIWEWQHNRLIGNWLAHTAHVADVKFGPGTIISCSRDRTIRIWDAHTHAPVATLLGHTGEVNRLILVPDESNPIIASGSNDATLRLWRNMGNDDRGVPTLNAHPSWVYSVAFSPDASLIASGGGWRPKFDGSVRLWDARSFELLRTYQGPPEQIVWSANFLPGAGPFIRPYESDILLPSDVDRPALALVQGREVVMLDHALQVAARASFDDQPCSLAVRAPCAPERDSADPSSASTLAVGFWRTGGGDVQILNAETLEVLQVIPTGSPCGRLTFSPCGRLAAIQAPAPHSSILVVDACTRAVLDVLELPDPHPAISARRFNFSHDGRWLIATWWGSTATTVAPPPTLWDLQSRPARLAASLHGHSGGAVQAVFSPQGDRIATGAGDNTVRLWDVPTGEEVLTLHGHGFHVLDLAFSPDGRRLMTSSGDGTIRFWETARTPAPEAPEVRIQD